MTLGSEILATFCDVNALPITQRAKQILPIIASLGRVLRHSLGFVEVDVPRYLLQLTEILHIFNQLIMRTVEAGIDVYLILMHEKWRLQRRRSVPLLPLTMINLKVIHCQELTITLLLQGRQLFFQLLVIFCEVVVVVLPLNLEIRQFPLQLLILL